MSNSWAKTFISSVCMTAVATLGYALLDQASHYTGFYSLIQNSTLKEHSQVQ